MTVKAFTSTLFSILLTNAAIGQSSPEILLNRIYQDFSPAVAERQLEKQGKRDPATCQLLSARLPVLLLDTELLNTKDVSTLVLLAQLAGNLKLVSTIPALNQLLSDNRSKPMMMTGFYRAAELLDDPIGAALAQIGEPAVPAVAQSLQVPSARTRAIYVLAKIGGPEAANALRQALDHADDPIERAFLGASIKRASEAPATKAR